LKRNRCRACAMTPAVLSSPVHATVRPSIRTAMLLERHKIASLGRDAIGGQTIDDGHGGVSCSSSANRVEDGIMNAST